MKKEYNLVEKNCINFLDSKYHNFYGHKNLKYNFKNILMINCFFKQNYVSVFADINKTPLPQTLDELIFWLPTCICSFFKGNQLELEVKNRIEYINNTCVNKEILDKLNLNGGKQITKLEGEFIDLTHPFGFYAFGHLFDTLQRLFVFKEILNNKNIKFIISKDFKIKDFKKHLSALCQREINDDSLIRADSSDVFSISDLHYGLSPSVPTQMTRESFIWIIESYFEYFKVTNTEPKYNLYLDRNHVSKNARGVINNEEVLNFLKNKDFICIKGSEPLEDIIKYFANANYIVGSHGSLFANCMFCNSNTKILEFCPNNRKDLSFLYKLKLTQDYKQVLVEADDSYNIEIDIDIIKNYFNL